MKFPVLCFLRVGQGVAAARGPQAWGGTFCGMTVERGSQVGLCCPFLSMILHGFTRPFTGFSEVHRTIQELTRCPCLYSRLLRSTGNSKSSYQAVKNCRKHFNTRLGSGTEREETRGALRDNQCLSSLIFTNMKTLRFAYISPIAFAC